ncbi:Sphingolipid delta(4)-desaturase [Penicillium argentinense]|uniref:Sphingolipid delta(4)-desaturase n=1 Tax=Penicillium argentinense TaxID=1131581 RepID=A0A9W9EHN4_9EURO|nr:Sphingolipid delta(4)-desaturase [Penicillium argentinense]KAJ5081978.1 Sphingolipid delta(4)-desaturase [Penicillium argentinense]
MSAVETASPHLRVSAATASSPPAKEAISTRIPAPETSAVEDRFFWTYTEEPHRSRRQAIIKAHPEVRYIR